MSTTTFVVHKNGCQAQSSYAKAHAPLRKEEPRKNDTENRESRNIQSSKKRFLDGIGTYQTTIGHAEFFHLEILALEIILFETMYDF